MNTQNPLARILSFLDPKANRQRLEDIGLYAPRGAGYPTGGKSPAMGFGPQATGFGMPTAPLTPPPDVPDNAPKLPSTSEALSYGKRAPNSPTSGSSEKIGGPKYKTAPAGTSRYNRAAVEKIINMYTEAGYDPKFAVGMAANAMIESGGDPNAFNKAEGAFGLFQHRNDRLDNMKDFVNRMGSDATDLGAQISFSMYELSTFEKGAYEKIMGYNPQSAPEYAALIDKYYERSAGIHRDKRTTLASQIYSDFYGEDGSYSGGAARTENGNILSFGAKMGVGDPMQTYQGLSMGRQAEGSTSDFTTPASLARMEEMGAPAPEEQYDDAILRYLRNPAPDFADRAPEAAENQSNALSFGLPSTGLATSEPLANWDTILSSASKEATTGTSGPSGTSGTNSPTGGSSAEPKKLGFVERMFDKMYGTKTDDLSEDERKDRSRAIGMALSQGFQMLSRGERMDVSGIVGQRMELQQARRANAALKGNAQGVADMLTAAGFGDRAQLAFMGKEGMDAAMSLLTTIPKGTDAEFTLPSAYRATLAQTLIDNGQPQLAEGIMTLDGKALETLHSNVVSEQSKLKSGDGASGITYTPEMRQDIARILTESGNEEAARLVPYMDDDALNDVMKSAATVAPEVQKSVQSAAGTAGVNQVVSADSAAALAAGYDAAGMPELADIARAAPNYEAAVKAIDDKQKADTAAAEASDVKARGAAVAELIPDDAENAQELKAAARAALTSQDLDQVYSRIAKDPATTEEKLYNLAKEDPQFMKFLSDYNMRKAGKDPTRKFSHNLLMTEMTAATDTFIASKSARQNIQRDMALVTKIASQPDFNPGIVQAELMYPAQKILTSLLGDAAPDILNDPTMTGMKVIETIQNANFAVMTGALKGAISDKETGFIRATLPSTGDTKTQILAIAQYHSKIVDLQEAEYAAMVEWMDKSEGTAREGDRNDMIAFVNEKTAGLSIYPEITYKTDDELDQQILEGLMSGKYKEGEVLRVIDATGNARFEAIAR